MPCAKHIYQSTFTNTPNDALFLTAAEKIIATRDLTTYIYTSTIQGTTTLPNGLPKPRYFKSYQDYLANLKGRNLQAVLHISEHTIEVISWKQQETPLITSGEFQGGDVLESVLSMLQFQQ